MAITYHSGRRLQGLSTDFEGAPETGTIVHDFSFSSAPANWNYRVAGSSSHWDNDNSRLNWETKSASSGSGADYDLGVQTDNWTLRFTIRIDSSQSGYVDAGQGDGVMMFGLQNYPSTSAYTASTPNSQNDSTYAETHQMAQMILLFKSAATEGSGKYRVGGRCETSTTGNWSGAELDVNINDDTDYFIEVKRTNSTTFTISVGSNSDYSTGRTTGTYNVTANSLDGLRYIHLEEHAQNSLYDSYGGGILTDLKFWSGDVSSKPTNVQAGSRIEETDTRKMYHYNAPTLSFEDDFDTDSGWTTAGTSVIDTTNEYWRQLDRTPMYKSLGVSLDTTWVSDLDIYWTGIGTSGWQGYVMFTNYGATAYNSSTGTPQYIGLRQRTDGKETLRITNYAGGETNATDVFMATGASANTWYFYRVIRNGNDATLTRYTSDANRTSDTGGVSITSTGFVAQVSWDESVKIQYIDGTGYSSDQEYRIKNVKIYNGATSPDTAWSEEGT